jgi:hypothetical protein
MPDYECCACVRIFVPVYQILYPHMEVPCLHITLGNIKSYFKMKLPIRAQSLVRDLQLTLCRVSLPFNLFSSFHRPGSRKFYPSMKFQIQLIKCQKYNWVQTLITQNEMHTQIQKVAPSYITNRRNQPQDGSLGRRAHGGDDLARLIRPVNGATTIRLPTFRLLIFHLCTYLCRHCIY